MGDGDGSDGSTGDGGVGAGDGGVGAGDGGGGDFFYSSPSSNAGSYDSGLQSIFNSDDDPNNPFRNKKYMGMGFGQNQGWEFANAYRAPSNGVDFTGSQVYTPYDAGLASSLGYTGSGPLGVQGGINVSDDKAFSQYLQDKGYQLARSYTPGGQGAAITQAFDKSGNPVGKSTNWNESMFGDKDFGTVVGLLAAAAGGAAGAGLAGSYGLTGAAAGAAQGAGAGFAGTLSQTADIGAGLKGAAVGGLTGGIGSGLGGANLAQYAGLDGQTGQVFNNVASGAIRGGVGAGLQGGSIGAGALSGATNAGVSGGVGLGRSLFGDYLASNNNPDYSNEGYGKGVSTMPDYLQGEGGEGGYSQAPWASQTTFDRLNGAEPNYSVAPGSNPNNPNSFDLASTMQSAPPQNPNPVKSGIMNALGRVNSFMSNQGPGRMDVMGSGLMDLWNRYRQNRAQGGLADNLSSMFGPNSPYAQQLAQTLQRHDAAAGRNSQVGPRSVELQARLAEMNSRNAPMLNQLYNQQSGNRNAMLGDIFRMMSNQRGGGGGLGMLQSMFPQQQSNMTGYNPASDYSYQNGSDLGG